VKGEIKKYKCPKCKMKTAYLRLRSPSGVETKQKICQRCGYNGPEVKR
jgi:hypothetical protein